MGSSIREKLDHVLWLGGGSGAGKTTIARRLAATHGLDLYETDEVMADHAYRCAPGEAPYLAAFQSMSIDERWVDPAPQTMLETFHWFRGEAFDLIVEDLLTLPLGRKIIVEGFRLLPSLVKPWLADTSHAVWLLPTPQFRAAAFESRGTTWSIAGKTRDPKRALGNLLERDRLFTDRLRNEAAGAGVATIDIDGSMAEDVLEEWVAAHFGL